MNNKRMKGLAVAGVSLSMVHSFSHTSIKWCPQRAAPPLAEWTDDVVSFIHGELDSNLNCATEPQITA